MVVNRQPFGPASRFVAYILAGICVVFGGIGLLMGVSQRRPLVAVLSLGMVALGVLYAGAAWRGRPWR